MRKKFLTVAATAVMTMSMLMSAFADTESDLIAHYGFDENTKNEVTGEEAKQTGQKFADAAGNTFTYEDGVNGKALVMAKGNTDGYNLNVAATGDSYTISLWLKGDEINGFADPIVWYGSTNQSPESWVGIWPGLQQTWTHGGPVIGSNDSSGARAGVHSDEVMIVDAVTSVNIDWHMITAVIDGEKASLYYDGKLVGDTVLSYTDEAAAEHPEAVMPSVTGDDKSFYLGVNAWDVPFAGTVDELYIYDRALTADDVKELFESTNTEGVEVAEGETPAETEARKPQLAQKGEFTQSTSEADDDDNDNTMMIIIIAVVVVVVVVVVVAVASSSKKKNKAE